jgi:hypothetical protein
VQQTGPKSASGQRTKINPKWLSISSPVAFSVKFEVISPLAPANWPSPSSTRQITEPCCSAGSGLLPRKPCPTVLNRSEWFESPKRIVPVSLKDVSPVSVTSDSNDAFPLRWQQNTC